MASWNNRMATGKSSTAGRFVIAVFWCHPAKRFLASELTTMATTRNQQFLFALRKPKLQWKVVEASPSPGGFSPVQGTDKATSSNHSPASTEFLPSPSTQLRAAVVPRLVPLSPKSLVALKGKPPSLCLWNPVRVSLRGPIMVYGHPSNPAGKIKNTHTHIQNPLFGDSFFACCRANWTLYPALFFGDSWILMPLSSILTNHQLSHRC